MRETVSVLASFKDSRILEGIVLSMEFRCVRDLRSQDQLVDSKMIFESKAVALVTLLMVWQRIESL